MNCFEAAARKARLRETVEIGVFTPGAEGGRPLTLPIVRKTGGLADTVDPLTATTGNGFVFREYQVAGLVKGIREALDFYAKPLRARAKILRRVMVDSAQRFTIAEPWRAKFAPGVTSNLEHAFALAVPAPFEPRLNPAEHRRHLWLSAREAIARASSWTDRNAIARVFPELRGAR